ncbi:putative multiple inositol polyphosphate phosphatase, partial [Operophtera brumata]
MITFTDTPMLLATLSALGARQDSAPLTGDNYRTPLVQARRWTTSTMAPFNGNLAAVLYKCTPNGNFQINDQYQVLFLENEKPMYIEECRVALCDWSFVKHKFGEMVGKCDLEFCNGAARLAFGVSLVLGL